MTDNRKLLILFHEELDDIKERVEAAHRLPVVDVIGDHMPDKIVRNDVPRLIATIEHLWQVVAEFKEDQERRG